MYLQLKRKDNLNSLKKHLENKYLTYVLCLIQSKNEKKKKRLNLFFGVLDC